MTLLRRLHYFSLLARREMGYRALFARFFRYCVLFPVSSILRNLGESGNSVACKNFFGNRLVVLIVFLEILSIMQASQHHLILPQIISSTRRGAELHSLR